MPGNFNPIGGEQWMRWMEQRMTQQERRRYGSSTLGDDVLHAVGGTDEPAFQNGWVNYGSGHQSVNFTRNSGRVYLEGLMKAGTLGAAFTLPDGFRPPANMIFLVSSVSGAARVDVNPGGNVLVVYYTTGGADDYVSLSGVSFRAVLPVP